MTPFETLQAVLQVDGMKALDRFLKSIQYNRFNHFLYFNGCKITFARCYW